MNYIIVNPDELNHFGVKGMKWGIRKQRPIGNDRQTITTSNQTKRNDRTSKAKRYIKTGAKIAVGALAAYSVYKIAKHPTMYKGEKLVAKYLSKGHMGKEIKIATGLSNARTVTGYSVVAGMLGTTGYKGYKKFNNNYEITKKASAKNSNVNNQLKQLQSEERKETKEYQNKTKDWSSIQKSVYNSTGKKVDPSAIKTKSNGSTVVDMGNYEIVYRADGSTVSRPKKK